MLRDVADCNLAERRARRHYTRNGGDAGRDTACLCHRQRGLPVNYGAGIGEARLLANRAAAQATI